METRLLHALTPADPDLREAADRLRRGELVAFPTETVYGLGALGLDARAVERIFAAKGRPHSDPVILHVGDPAWVPALVRSLPPLAERAMEAFWPGPLTLVLPKSERVPDVVTAGGDSVAVRMPAHPLALELIRQVGEPVAAPSANLFSRTSPTTAEHVLQDLSGRIEAVLDGGPTTVGVESTVLDLRGPEPVILRPGGVTQEQLARVLECPVSAPGQSVDDGEPAVSPGQLTRHYSPRAEMRLFAGPDAAVLAALRHEAERANSPQTTAVLAFSEDEVELQGLPAEVVDLGSRTRPEQAARALYAAMRDLDARGVTLILARLAPHGGLGDAVNDRLRRAASGRITQVE